MFSRRDFIVQIFAAKISPHYNLLDYIDIASWKQHDATLCVLSYSTQIIIYTIDFLNMDLVKYVIIFKINFSVAFKNKMYFYVHFTSIDY